MFCQLNVENSEENGSKWKQLNQQQIQFYIFNFILIGMNIHFVVSDKWIVFEPKRKITPMKIGIHLAHDIGYKAYASPNGVIFRLGISSHKWKYSFSFLKYFALEVT